MNLRLTASGFTKINPVPVRLLPVLLLALAVSGCVNQPMGSYPIEMLPRNGDTVSHGVISHEFPLTTTLVIDIDRRIFMGNAERTAPNATFGFDREYGQNRRTGGSARTPGRYDYYKAILSSTDHHILRCDLTYDEDNQRDGLCVDDFGRIYDVVSSR